MKQTIFIAILFTWLLLGGHSLRFSDSRHEQQVQKSAFEAFIKQIQIQRQIADYFINQTDYHNEQGFFEKNKQLDEEVKELQKLLEADEIYVSPRMKNVCPNLTIEEKTAIQKQSKQVQVKNIELGLMLSSYMEQCKGCDQAHDEIQKQIDLIQQLTNLTKQTLNKEHCPQKKPSVNNEKASGLVDFSGHYYKNNLQNADNWIWGSTTESDYKKKVFEQSAKYNLLNCPEETPYTKDNGEQCFDCKNGTFNLGTETCIYCTLHQHVNQQTGECQQCHNNSEWDIKTFRCRACDTHAGYNIDKETAKCVKCNSSALYDPKEQKCKLIQCPEEEPHLNVISKKCFKCPQGEEINPNDQTQCIPIDLQGLCHPETPYYSFRRKKCYACPKDMTYQKKINKCRCTDSELKFSKTEKKCTHVCQGNLIWSSVHSQCIEHCPEDYHYDFKSKKCLQKCPNAYEKYIVQDEQCEKVCKTYQSYDNLNDICRDPCQSDQKYNPVEKKCVHIDSEFTLHSENSESNGEYIGICPKNKPFYSTKFHSCLQCPKDTTYNAKTHSCQDNFGNSEEKTDTFNSQNSENGQNQFNQGQNSQGQGKSGNSNLNSENESENTNNDSEGQSKSGSEENGSQNSGRTSENSGEKSQNQESNSRNSQGESKENSEGVNGENENNSSENSQNNNESSDKNLQGGSENSEQSDKSENPSNKESSQNSVQKSCQKDEVYNQQENRCQKIKDTCKQGETYVAVLNQCTSKENLCAEDEVYDQELKNCRTKDSDCKSEEIYDIEKGKCITISSTCGESQKYDEDLKKCVNRQQCTSDEVFDQESKKCRNKAENCQKSEYFSDGQCKQKEYLTSPYLPNLIYEDQFSKYIDYYNTFKQADSHRGDCLITTPYFDGQQCIQCEKDEPYFNLGTKECMDCPDGKQYSITQRICTKPQGKDYPDNIENIF